MKRNSTFSYNRKRLAFSQAGRGSVAIIFLPGLGSSRTAWKEQAKVFSKSHKVYSLDLLGHGASSKNVAPRRAINDNAKILGAFLRTMDRPYVLVAHSWAGSVVVRTRLKALKLLAGIIFVDCTRIDRKALRSYHDFAGSFLSKAPRERKKAAREWYLGLIGSDSKTLERELIKPLLRLDLEQIFQIANAIEITPKVPVEGVPILICEADQFFGTERFQTWSFRKITKRADYKLLPKAKHFFFRTQPARFNKVLRNFLSTKVNVTELRGTP